MIDETLQSLTKGFPLADTLERIRHALSQNTTEIDLFRNLQDIQTTISSFSRPLPLSIVPLGTNANGIIGLDLSAPAIEHQTIPFVQGTSSGFWQIVRFSFEQWGEGDASNHATTSFHATADAARTARESGNEAREARHLEEALLCPLFTAESLEEIAAVQDRILSLAPNTGFDAFCLRLAHAGLDSETWRTIGAERAIANRVRSAIHAFHSAHFLGTELDELAPILRRIHIRGAWSWATHLLTLHERFRAGGN